MGKRILVVDDDETIRSLIKEIIVLVMGYEVVLARNPEEAIKIVSEKRVDLLITDRNMPGMPGEELVRCVKRDHPEIKIILISSDLSPEVKKVALAAEADIVMEKMHFIHIANIKFAINKLIG